MSGGEYHVMWFVVDAEHHLRVRLESQRELAPEFCELFGGCSCWVARVTNNLYDPDLRKKTKEEIDYQHTLPVLGCCDGSLSRDQRSYGDRN